MHNTITVQYYHNFFIYNYEFYYSVLLLSNYYSFSIAGLGTTGGVVLICVGILVVCWKVRNDDGHTVIVIYFILKSLGLFHMVAKHFLTHRLKDTGLLLVW